MDYEKLHKDTINNLQQMVRYGKITVETARSICADFVYENENENDMMWRLIKKYAKHTIPNAVLNEDHITRKQLETWLENQNNSQKGLFALEAERYLSESEENKDEKWIPKEIVKYLKEKGCFRSCWIAWLEKQGEKEKFIEKELGCIRGYREEALRRLQELEKQGEQIPITDFSNLRTWKYIVDVVLTEKEGIGQYLDSPFTEEIAKKLQKRFGNIEQKLTLEDAASAFLQALADTPYNNTPIVEAQAAVKQLLAFLSDPKAYDPNAINEHKSAEWSEEDEQLIDEVVVCLRKYAEKVQGGYSKSYVQSLADRIESLRPGNTCKATEWSEEDEAMFQGVIETEQYMLDVVYGRKIFAVGNEAIKEECTKELAWLKSLRPQKQWKPSTIQSKTIDGIPERDYYKQKKE